MTDRFFRVFRTNKGDVQFVVIDKPDAQKASIGRWAADEAIPHLVIDVLYSACSTREAALDLASTLARQLASGRLGDVSEALADALTRVKAERLNDEDRGRF